MTKRIALAVLLFVACRRPPETFAEGCDLLCTADAAKAVECNVVLPSYQESDAIGCVNLCCKGNECQKPLANPDAVLKCHDAIGRQSCLQYTSEDVPAVCRAVLR